MQRVTQFAALLLLLAASHVFAAEEIVDIKTPRGVTQQYLVSYEPEQKYTAVALLFPGGEGRAGLQRGIPQPGTNFLVRTRSLFVKNGVATAVVDTPTDLPTGMNDGFRMSREHADDVGAVIDEMRKRFRGVKVFLVGTSRGTISAAYVGAALSNKVDGVVLTSSLFNAARAGPGLSGFDYRSLKVPLLFVHHRDDGCRQTPYFIAQRLSSQYPLISVSGGDPPRSDPCEPFSNHGYLGREEPVINAISAWILSKPFDKDIR